MKALLTLLLSLPLLAAEEIPIAPRIESVELFKNGVTVVRASFEITKEATYRWDDIPQAVHGSFWVESDGLVNIQASTRLVEEMPPTEEPSGVLQKDLAGKQVTLIFQSPEGERKTASGTVWTLPEPEARQTPSSGALSGARWNPALQPPQSRPTVSTGSYLVLETTDGQREYISLGSIVSLTADGPFAPSPRRITKPVMLFDVKKLPSNGGRTTISYLTRGMAWAPSYLIDLSKPEQLSIRQNAVVKNELMALDNTELKLISGFPNIRFAHVDSPLWTGGSLVTFFQQLSQGSSFDGSASMSQMITYNVAPSATPPALPDVQEGGSPGDDLHFESIGKRTLLMGDSLSLDIAAATAPYQRVVEWKVPDSRDYRGRYQNRSGDIPDEEQPWDAIMFHNPFKFPMTTGPAMITEAGHFRGQSLSQWVNPGQSTCLQITKALSIRADYSEIEEEGEREIVWIGGNDYQRTKVKGTLRLHNFRKNEVTLNITSQFSGELLESDADPALSLRTEGVTSVNPRRELNWMLDLKAGGEQTVTFRYSVLVDR